MVQRRLKTWLLILAAVILSSSCSSTDKKKKAAKTPSPNTTEGSTHSNTNQSNSNRKGDGLKPNNPGYCGYKFELEEEKEVLTKFQNDLARTWYSSIGGNVEKSDGKERLFYNGIKLDPQRKAYIELKIYYENVFGPLGVSENITEVKEISTITYSKIYISKPYKIDENNIPRLLVLETEDELTRCLARGFEVREENNMDKLFVTSRIGTSSYGNISKVKDIADFFKEQNLYWGYKIKK